MNQEQLNAIKARAEKATPGPWFHRIGIFKHYVYSDNEDLGFSLQEIHPYDGREWATSETANFIAHARQDIPALIAEVERLRAEVDQAERQSLDHYVGREELRAEVERLKAYTDPKLFAAASNLLQAWEIHNNDRFSEIMEDEAIPLLEEAVKWWDSLPHKIEPVVPPYEG